MLVEKTLFGIEDKVRVSIDRLKYFEPDEGYYLAFSGGKDSIVIKELAKMAGVNYDIHHSLTTIDPPELIYFMREHHHDVIIDRPDMPFLTRLVTIGFPQRHRRWCCAEYKEKGGSGRFVMTGVRWAESARRRTRKTFESCYTDITKRYVNPILDWTEDDVWDFIKERDLPYCSLYDEGWKRIGCLFCPMARKMRQIQAKKYPRYVKAFIKAFEELHSTGRDSMKRWGDGEEMFWWWMDSNQKSEEKDQLVMFE